MAIRGMFRNGCFGMMFRIILLANFRDDLITVCTHNFQTFELPTALKNNNHEKNFQYYWKQYS